MEGPPRDESDDDKYGGLCFGPATEEEVKWKITKGLLVERDGEYFDMSTLSESQIDLDNSNATYDLESSLTMNTTKDECKLDVHTVSNIIAATTLNESQIELNNSAVAEDHVADKSNSVIGLSLLNVSALSEKQIDLDKSVVSEDQGHDMSNSAIGLCLLNISALSEKQIDLDNSGATYNVERSLTTNTTREEGELDIPTESRNITATLNESQLGLDDSATTEEYIPDDTSKLNANQIELDNSVVSEDHGHDMSHSTIGLCLLNISALSEKQIDLDNSGATYNVERSLTTNTTREEGDLDLVDGPTALNITAATLNENQIELDKSAVAVTEDHATNDKLDANQIELDKSTVSEYHATEKSTLLISSTSMNISTLNANQIALDSSIIAEDHASEKSTLLINSSSLNISTLNANQTVLNNTTVSEDHATEKSTLLINLSSLNISTLNANQIELENSTVFEEHGTDNDKSKPLIDLSNMNVSAMNTSKVELDKSTVSEDLGTDKSKLLIDWSSLNVSALNASQIALDNSTVAEEPMTEKSKLLIDSSSLDISTLNANQTELDNSIVSDDAATEKSKSLINLNDTVDWMTDLLAMSEEQVAKACPQDASLNLSPACKVATPQKSVTPVVTMSPLKHKRLLQLKGRGGLFSPSPPRPAATTAKAAAACFKTPPRRLTPVNTERRSSSPRQYAHIPARVDSGLRKSPIVSLGLESPVADYIHSRVAPSPFHRVVGIPKNILSAGKSAKEAFMSRIPRPSLPATTSSILKEYNSQSSSGKFKERQYVGSKGTMINNESFLGKTWSDNYMVQRHTGFRDENADISIVQGAAVPKKFVTPKLVIPKSNLRLLI